MLKTQIGKNTKNTDKLIFFCFRALVISSMNGKASACQSALTNWQKYDFVNCE